MGKRKIDSETLRQLLNDFDSIVEPWCIENKLSLHQAFEISRENDKEKYDILSNLWASKEGKYYLQVLFKSSGGVLR